MKLPVHIRQDGDVDYEVVNLRRSASDEIVWSSEGDEFSVHFPITPFDEHTFHVPAGGTKGSGPVRPDAAIAHYQYFVTDVALAKSADPGANVKQ